ncbi:hypothetical protein FBUS_04816 [Fasciolopsis buskii]|uniref:Uncharacterized protein n=1 Tax=Fasciolopsis buskii TaxID=27845 RepID=A0A8E0VHC9_9TREM|nr:hypothetical protein FBUS_04816 [Fasciolopsis buski]
MHRLSVFLLTTVICLSWAKPQWQPKVPGPPRLKTMMMKLPPIPTLPTPPSIHQHLPEGLFPDLMKRILRSPPLPPTPPVPSPLRHAEHVPFRHMGGWRFDHHYSWKRPNRMLFSSVRPNERKFSTDYELPDGDNVPFLIEEIKSPRPFMDSFVSEDYDSKSELVHMLLKFLQSIKLKKKPQVKRYYRLPKSIVITQPASETTTTMTSITQPTSCTCPQSSAETGGTPRSAFPVQSASYPTPSAQPVANVLPVSSVPSPQTQPTLPGPNSLSATPRSAITQATPTGTASTSVGSVPVTITQSQTTATLSPQKLDTNKQISQKHSKISYPLLSEIKTILLEEKPEVKSQLEGFELANGGALLTPVALTHMPKLELTAAPSAIMAVPIAAAYSTPKVVSETATDIQTTDARTSLTDELVQLMNALQQQQRQQQQQQPQQQQQQDLLEQQPSHLNQQPQMQQPQQTMQSASSPLTPIQPTSPQMIPGQSRSGLPVSDYQQQLLTMQPVAQPQQITLPYQEQQQTQNYQLQQRTQQATLPQQTAQQESTTIISVVPRTLLTLATEDDGSYGDYGATDKVTRSTSFYDLYSAQPMLRRKIFPRKLIHRPKNILGFTF